MTSYESVLELVSSAPRAASPDVRDIVWATDAQIVGISRDYENHVELFLRGTELAPSSSIVKNAVEFRSWHRDSSSPLNANRLTLPALGHFDQIAAFVCTELLRNGADSSLSEAFANTEPLVELAIEQLLVSNESVLGLIGELVVLDALVRNVGDDKVSIVLNSWHGWRRSLRDISLGQTGIEVKTTTRTSSSHGVQGLHQIEASDSSSEPPSEDRLFLVSVGLKKSEPGDNSFSIPSLVDRIAKRAEAASAHSSIDSFFWRLTEYGSNSGGGYSHPDDAETLLYRSAYSVTFFRTYDMGDENIKCFNSSDLSDFTNVDLTSLKFRIDLPTVVDYKNPVMGINESAKQILKSWIPRS